MQYIFRQKFWLIFKKLKLPRKTFAELHTSFCYEKYIKLYPLWFWCVNDIWSECQKLLIFGGALTLTYISFFCLFLHFVLFSLFSWLISNLQKWRHTDCSIIGGALSLRSIFFLCMIFTFLDYFNFLPHVFSSICALYFTSKILIGFQEIKTTTKEFCQTTHFIVLWVLYQIISLVILMRERNLKRMPNTFNFWRSSYLELYFFFLSFSSFCFVFFVFVINCKFTKMQAYRLLNYWRSS